MAIKCDKCNADVTPNENTEIKEYRVLTIQGEKFCLCTDCLNAVYNFIKGE